MVNSIQYNTNNFVNYLILLTTNRCMISKHSVTTDQQYPSTYSAYI